MKELITGHILSETDALQLYTIPSAHYMDVRKWCRKNCRYTWGYSAAISSFSIWNPQCYFLFENEMDVLTLRLSFPKLEEVRKRTMWESGTKFTITRITL